jgi:hypothetical protein
MVMNVEHSRRQCKGMMTPGLRFPAQRECHLRLHSRPSPCANRARIDMTPTAAEAGLHVPVAVPGDLMGAIERRLLLGALSCAVLLIGGYFVFVSLPWGHQVDDDAYFGRKALSRKVVQLDSDVLDLVSKTALLIAAMVRSSLESCVAVLLPV